MNWAEISSDDGNDVDSTPDSDQTNDGQPTGPGAPGDNVVDNSGGDEDDHDPAGVSVATFDLALQKFYTSDTFGAPTDGVIQAGSDVTFTITVTNQGTLDAGTFDVTDFLPAGFVLNDPAWTDNGDGTATITAGPLAPLSSVDIPITITAVNPSLGDLVNVAEISADDGPDIDSTPDSDQTNDNQPGAPGDPTDNAIDNSAGDEDDQDIAGLTVVEYDLALQKVYTSDTFAAPADGIIEAGADVTFTITVTNQGTVDAGTFDVTDFLPAGFVLNDAAWTDNGDDTATYTGGPLAAGASVDIDITLTAVSPGLGESVNWAEISSDDGDDVDSTPDANQANDSQPAAPGAPTDNVVDNTAGDEDDHDPAGVSVENFDLALIKVFTSDTFDDATDGLIENGADATFTITVTNQGTVDATAVEVTDFLPAGFVLNDAAWTDNGDGTATTVIPAIASGASADVTITLTAVTPALGDNINVAEISGAVGGNDIDSTPDTTADNDGPVTDDEINNGSGDEDDNDPAPVTVEEPVFDLALIKTLQDGTNSASAAVGDNVTWTITIFNQGDIHATDINVIDFIPSGLDVVDADWTETANGDATIAIPGILAPGDSVSVDVTTVVVDGTDLENIAEISGALASTAGGAPLVLGDGSPILDIDSIPDTSNSDTRVDDVTDNTGGDEDDNDGASLILASAETPPATTTPSGPLAVTGVESWQLALLSLTFLAGGLLLLGFSRRRKEEEQAA